MPGQDGKHETIQETKSTCWYTNRAITFHQIYEQLDEIIVIGSAP